MMAHLSFPAASLVKVHLQAHSSRPAHTFVYRALASPASASGICTGPDRKSFEFPSPGPGRRANEEREVPKAQSEDGCEMRADNVPKGLKFEKKKRWITAFK